jgi:serine/threonine protein kinase
LNVQSLVGELIAERYELLSIVGAGGMGTVYRARQIDLDRVVAIKFLDTESVASQEMYSRFQLEARALSQLKHKNIAGFYSFGSLPTGVPFIVMEYLEGQDLAAALSLGAFPAERVVNIAIQVARGMDYAHQAKLVHRDLKPGNILLVANPDPDSVKILDFGLAKHIEVASNQNSTRTGQLVGTPQYLSPEQCRGTKQIDARSDIYSLGCLIYEMLIGAPPFEADSAVGYLYLHMNEKVVFPCWLSKDDVTRALLSVIEHCMEKDPDKRYQSMSALEQDLCCIKEKRFMDIVSPAVVPDVRRTVMVKVAIASIVSLAVGIFATVLFSKIHQHNADTQVTTESLTIAIKEAERRKDKQEATRLLKTLKTYIRDHNTADQRGGLFLGISRELSAYPHAANYFAMEALTESISSSKNKKGSAEQGREPTPLEKKTLMLSGASANWLYIDSEKMLEAARTIDSASKILIGNKYPINRTLMVFLMAPNRVLSVLKENQLGAFNELLIQNAERLKLAPSKELLDLYRHKVFFTRFKSDIALSSITFKKARDVADSVYGPNSGTLASIYIEGINAAHPTAFHTESIAYASELTDRYANAEDPAWSQVCDSLAFFGICSKEWDKVVKYASKGLEIETSDAFDMAKLLKYRAHAYLYQRQLSKSLADSTRGHELAVRHENEQVENKWLRSQLVAPRFCSMDLSGSKTQARKFLDDELALLKERKMLNQEIEVLSSSAGFLFEYNDIRAIEFFDNGLKLARKSKEAEVHNRAIISLLSAHNKFSSRESHLLNETLDLLVITPTQHWWVDVYGGITLKAAIERYERHKFQKELASALPKILIITGRLNDSDATFVLKDALSLLEAAEKSNIENADLAKEVGRLRGILSKRQ